MDGICRAIKPDPVDPGDGGVSHPVVQVVSPVESPDISPDNMMRIRAKYLSSATMRLQTLTRRVGAMDALISLFSAKWTVS